MVEPRTRITLLGTGGATPYAQRVNAAAIASVSNSSVLFDSGSGVSQRLAQAGMPISSLDLICLSHLHADHCLEVPLVILGAFLSGRNRPIKIVGPSGTSAHIDLVMNSVYPYLHTLIENVTGSGPRYDVVDVDSGLVFEANSYTVKCAPVVHGVPALGFRLDAQDRSVAVSGDTEKCESMADLAKGVDILIHECPFPPDMGHIPGHTTALEVGQIAAQAGAAKVILTHLFEETLGKEDDLIAEVRKSYQGTVLVGTDVAEI